MSNVVRIFFALLLCLGAACSESQEVTVGFEAESEPNVSAIAEDLGTANVECKTAFWLDVATFYGLDIPGGVNTTLPMKYGKNLGPEFKSWNGHIYFKSVEVTFSHPVQMELIEMYIDGTNVAWARDIVNGDPGSFFVDTTFNVRPHLEERKTNWWVLPFNIHVVASEVPTAKITATNKFKFWLCGNFSNTTVDEIMDRD